MKRFYALANLFIIVVLIAWNYLANAMGIQGNTIGSLSSEYANLFTPAGYAFSIWGPIYLGLLALGIYQVRKVFFDRKGDEFVLQMGPWLIITNLANGAWVWVWLSEYPGLSVILMILMLVSLILVILRLNMERWDAPFSLIAWVWWPICLYSGWIAVATIANLAAYLSKTGWQFLFSEITWTLIMILLAAGVNLFMVINRNMREFAVVGAWALVAVSVRHWDSIPSLQWTALVGALVLVVAVAIHGYRNRATHPFRKLRQATDR
jgi:hypothetical protein